MIKATRSNENNSVCKESKEYFGLRKGMRYGDAVSPKGNQPWIFTEKTDAEAEAPILQLPDAKSWVIGKDPDAGKYWRQEEKGTTEDEMVGWHHQLNGHAFRQTGRRWRTGEPGAAVHEVAKSQTWLSYRTSGDAFS